MFFCANALLKQADSPVPRLIDRADFDTIDSELRLSLERKINSWILSLWLSVFVHVNFYCPEDPKLRAVRKCIRSCYVWLAAHMWGRLSHRTLTQIFSHFYCILTAWLSINVQVVVYDVDFLSDGDTFLIVSHHFSRTRLWGSWLLFTL